MKHVPQIAGPFRKWPFFAPHEIEKTATDDLRTHGLLPAVPREIDVDSLVQKCFGFSPTYTTLGDGILGYIRFGKEKPEVIIIDESLADMDASPTTEHRRRSTLAHEIGHGRLHVIPFTELMQVKGSGHRSEWVRSPALQGAFACRQQDIAENAPATAPSAVNRNLPTWERMAEWQANRYMAAVLTPARLMRLAVDEALGHADTSAAAPLVLSLEHCDRLAPTIAERFNVSRQLATVRLRELFGRETTGVEDLQGDLFAAAGQTALWGGCLKV